MVRERESVRGEEVFTKRKIIDGDGVDESSQHKTTQHCEYTS